MATPQLELLHVHWLDGGLQKQSLKLHLRVSSTVANTGVFLL
jgi:hypothetical protein